MLKTLARLIILSVVVWLVVFFVVYDEASDDPLIVTSPSLELVDLSEPPSREQQLLESMSLAQKVGQTTIIGIGSTVLDELTKRLIKDVNPGGVILFTANIENNNQLSKLTEDLQIYNKSLGNPPLFIAVDQEGGIVRRITWLDDQVAQSSITNAKRAYNVGYSRGEALMSLGINLNLAPVLDLATKDDYIYNRTFRGTAESIAVLAEGLIAGHGDAGLLTAIKHFPGYGGIDYDPEKFSVPVLAKLPEISQFSVAQSAVPAFVMVSNVIYKEIDADLPFALSPRGIDYLKSEYPGEYLVITDDLSSPALARQNTLGQTAIKAMRAGSEILLITGNQRPPNDAPSAIRAMLMALKDDEVSTLNLDARVLKILRLKQAYFTD